jgi:prolyl-tRNA editing enzyme YbaK/EbsC (Cys-tRNA(Pro) deacylase)
LSTFIDRDLLAYDIVYAAGGTPHALFAIAPPELVRVSGGKVSDTRLLIPDNDQGA